jgi:hypothetical protein
MRSIWTVRPPTHRKQSSSVLRRHANGDAGSRSTRPDLGLKLRARFTSGDHTDVRYEERDATDEDEVIERVVAALASDSGVLRCHHGDRLLVVFARDVATIEPAPRGAIL